jgi:hypothetical protein
VVLLDDVVEVFTLPQPHAVRQEAVAFQLPDRDWIGRILIQIDNPRFFGDRLNQR